MTGKDLLNKLKALKPAVLALEVGVADCFGKCVPVEEVTTRMSLVDKLEFIQLDIDLYKAAQDPNEGLL